MNHAEIESAIQEAPADKKQEVAASHGRAVIDALCKCGAWMKGKIIGTATHRDWSPIGEMKYVQCPKCGMQGQWTDAKVSQPEEPAKVESAEPAKAA